jgi:hypothetical protein
MENALPIFALAFVLAAGAVVIRAFADWWVRARQLEHAERQMVADPPLAAIEARLTRIEQAVEAIAVEIERVSEAQRFTTNLLAERRPSEPLLPSGERRIREQG